MEGEVGRERGVCVWIFRSILMYFAVVSMFEHTSALHMLSL